MAQSNHALEETLAHMVKTVEELSDVVAWQDKEITLLRAQMDALLDLAKDGLEDGGSVVIGERPPHY
ncbi:MAG: SlyX family protein [Pseudomonadota bacterium]